MKIITLLFFIIVLAGIGGVGYVALTDIDIQQEEQTISIPAERFSSPSD
jgi:hypothetical protein